MINLVEKSRLFSMTLYDMYNLKDLDEYAGIKKENLDYLIDNYGEKEVAKFFEVIKLAVENPDYDFVSLFPGMPHSNIEVYNCICKLSESLSQLTTNKN